MSINVQLCYINGETKDLEISLSENIGERKKKENQENAIWKCLGKVLKKEKEFGFYGIERGDIIYSSAKSIGG
jgi:hypothetical protein